MKNVAKAIARYGLGCVAKIFRRDRREVQRSIYLSLFLEGWRLLRERPDQRKFLLGKLINTAKLIRTGKVGIVLQIIKHRRIDVVIITPPHSIYIAHLIENTLKESGRSVAICNKYECSQDKGQRYFIICPQVFSYLPKNYVAVQMEQCVNARWFTPEYLAILDRAEAILDYSSINIEYLISQGIPLQKIFYMPIGILPEYDKYLSGAGYDLPETGREIDVLFYGDLNCERIKSYLKALDKRFNLHIASETFGEEMLALIMRSKVVVNVHYYEGALLETARIYETLSLGIPVVSEASVDIDQHGALSGVVKFTPVGDIDAMIEEVARLLEDKQYMSESLVSIQNFMKRDSLFTAYLRRYLLAANLMSFEEYRRLATLLPEIEEDIPRLCLTLTETAKRKAAFLKKPTHGFKVVEGLRNELRWIGCGLSYKHMLSCLQRQRATFSIICEDDVIFPADIEEKLDKVINYLSNYDGSWHLFSGFISHLHADTNILKIEEADSIEYIHIDRMTSMVMNIYSTEAFDMFDQWDETNTDVETNTIDRHIENYPNLTVITTFPFLVQHAETQMSTLWDAPNTQYAELIHETEKLFALKIEQYKAEKDTAKKLII